MKHRIPIKYIYVLCDCSWLMFRVFIIKKNMDCSIKIIICVPHILYVLYVQIFNYQSQQQTEAS